MHESGKIYSLEELGMTETQAKALGLVVIPKNDEKAVQSMNRAERRAYYAKKRKAKR